MSDKQKIPASATNPKSKKVSKPANVASVTENTNKHPKTHKVTYVMVDGSVAEINSCYSKSNKMILEVDIFHHAAWQENKQFINETVGNVAKFRQKYGLSADLFKKENK